MRIVLEGPDASGKSTLATKLGELLRLPVYRGIGPVRSELDFTSRWMEYCTRDVGVFDRHFCISEPIYNRFFDRGGVFYQAETIADFFCERPVIIYCQSPSHTLDTHVGTSPTDTPEYLTELAVQHARICEAYDDYFAGLNYPFITYQIGMSMGELLIQLEGRLNAVA